MEIGADYLFPSLLRIFLRPAKARHTASMMSLKLTIPWVPNPLRPAGTHVQIGQIADAKGGIPYRSSHHILSCHDKRFRMDAEARITHDSGVTQGKRSSALVGLHLRPNILALRFCAKLNRQRNSIRF